LKKKVKAVLKKELPNAINIDLNKAFLRLTSVGKTCRQSGTGR